MKYFIIGLLILISSGCEYQSFSEVKKKMTADFTQMIKEKGGNCVATKEGVDCTLPYTIDCGDVHELKSGETLFCNINL